MILGNHDRGKDSTGETLLKQIRVLQDKYCAWDLKIFNDQLNIFKSQAQYFSCKIRICFKRVSPVESLPRS